MKSEIAKLAFPLPGLVRKLRWTLIVLSFNVLSFFFAVITASNTTCKRFVNDHQAVTRFSTLRPGYQEYGDTGSQVRR